MMRKKRQSLRTEINATICALTVGIKYNLHLIREFRLIPESLSVDSISNCVNWDELTYSSALNFPNVRSLMLTTHCFTIQIAIIKTTVYSDDNYLFAFYLFLLVHHIRNAVRIYSFALFKQGEFLYFSLLSRFVLFSMIYDVSFTVSMT